eukprot:gene10295-11394_t
MSSSSSSSNAQSSSSSLSNSSAQDSPLLGIKVSWEIKLMAIVSIFALVKALPFAQTTLFLLLARLFFLLGHLLLGYIYFYTNFRITKSTSRSVEEKNEAKADCQKVFRGIVVKAVLLGLVHARTGLLPPMFVTVIMAFFSMIENDYFYQVMYAKMPQFFDLFFC